MVVSKSTASPYRVEAVSGAQGNTFNVMRGVVARFDNEEHATFLVDLLQKGQAHHGY